MTNKNIKNLLGVLLSFSISVVLGCSTSPVTSRHVSSIAPSDQSVEILDSAANLNNADTIIKTEENLKYKNIKLDSLQNLKLAQSWLEAIKANEDAFQAAYGLKKDYFKSVKVAAGLIEAMTDASSNISVIVADTRFYDLVNILTALRNRSDSGKEESLEILSAPIALLKHLQKPEVVVPGTMANLFTQTIQPITGETYNQEIFRPSVMPKAAGVCTYAGPKTGYGFKAGLKILCADKKLKLKFGPESHTGPFNSRIFRSLGFLTPRIDFVSNVEMKYDRKFITEFNSRKQTHTSVTVLGVKVSSKDWNTAIKDPFSFLLSVKLKDGTIVTGNALLQFKQTLLTQVNGDYKFVDSVESKIDSVTFIAGSVIEDIDAIEVGPWRFDESNHMNNEMLRQGLMINIWVGNNDLPMNNNRLLIIKDKKSEGPSNAQVIPIYIDVGVGLGVSDSIKGMSSYEIDKMSDSMSTLANDHNSNEDSSGQNQKLIFQFISKTPAKMIEKLTMNDVINGLKLMCRLAPVQIKTALKQSGIPETMAEMATEKLVNRRTKLIQDLQIQNQFSGCQ